MLSEAKQYVDVELSLQTMKNADFQKESMPHLAKIQLLVLTIKLYGDC
jgi:hypothetical protein